MSSRGSDSGYDLIPVPLQAPMWAWVGWALLVEAGSADVVFATGSRMSPAEVGYALSVQALLRMIPSV